MRAASPRPSAKVNNAKTRSTWGTHSLHSGVIREIRTEYRGAVLAVGALPRRARVRRHPVLRRVGDWMLLAAGIDIAVGQLVLATEGMWRWPDGRVAAIQERLRHFPLKL